MPKVKFVSNMQKDIENIWDKCNKPPIFGNFKIQQSLKDVCLGKSLSNSKPLLKKFLKKLYASHYIETYRKTVETLWRRIEEEFFKRMDVIMKHTYSREIVAYVTTIGICPYNPKESSFMVSLLYPLQMSIASCGHEIMHLYFHQFYWNSVEKKIGKKKTGDLKEALTILLNLEFKDLWLTQDQGYEEHKELREFISNSWKEEKDFEVLLKKCIKFLEDKG